MFTVNQEKIVIYDMFTYVAVMEVLMFVRECAAQSLMLEFRCSPSAAAS